MKSATQIKKELNDVRNEIASLKLSVQALQNIIAEKEELVLDLENEWDRQSHFEYCKKMIHDKNSMLIVHDGFHGNPYRDLGENGYDFGAENKLYYNTETGHFFRAHKNEHNKGEHLPWTYDEYTDLEEGLYEVYLSKWSDTLYENNIDKFYIQIIRDRYSYSDGCSFIRYVGEMETDETFSIEIGWEETDKTAILTFEKTSLDLVERIEPQKETEMEMDR